MNETVQEALTNACTEEGLYSAVTLSSSSPHAQASLPWFPEGVRKLVDLSEKLL